MYQMFVNTLLLMAGLVIGYLLGAYSILIKQPTHFTVNLVDGDDDGDFERVTNDIIISDN